MLKLLSSLVLTICLSIAAYASELEDLTNAAVEGDAEAQTRLGLRHFYGRGVPQDNKQAVMWLSLAAEQNYAIAQYNLGLYV